MKIIIMASLYLFSSLTYASFEVQKVTDNVYALVGELSQRSKTNLGNNSTHGVIITSKGVVLIDSGASYLGAKEIHKTIRKLTNKPIKIVINTGGQDHRWLGNDYFKKLGARIISSSKAKIDQKIRADEQTTRLKVLIGDSLKGTEPVFASETFDKKMNLDLGGVHLELYHFGAAHTAGDIVIWMPSIRVMFTGDIVFNDRMLGIGPAKDFQSWMNVFEKMASFKPKYIIPGHGSASGLFINWAEIGFCQSFLFMQRPLINNQIPFAQIPIAHFSQQYFRNFLNNEILIGQSCWHPTYCHHFLKSY
jgi:glyoxylase-like metal-dependent hydrolase (beta-lactamase superfamily II)